MKPDVSLERLAVAQHGVISRDQCLAAGLTLRAIRRRVESGRWELVHSAVFRLTAIDKSWEQRLMAAVLFGGPTALASHRSAAALWRLQGIEERPIEISVGAGRRIGGAIVHRRQPNDGPERVVKDRIPATGIDRTLVDLAAVVSPGRAGLALDDALRRRLTTLESTRGVLARGRPGAAALRRLLDARNYRDAQLESRLEAAMLALLRSRGLPEPVPQYSVTDGSDFGARLDFAYPSCRLGIEVDGFRWHSGAERWRRDQRRENRLKLLGWTVLRFSWDDVQNRPEIVASQIREALTARGYLRELPFSVTSGETLA
jgi:very-short-patch-repair endonuclease